MEYREISKTKRLVIEHLNQRQRFVEVDDPTYLLWEVEKLRRKWVFDPEEPPGSDGPLVGSDEVIGWKREELERKHSFPIFPVPVEKECYQSVFELRRGKTHPTQDIHEDDYVKFYISIENAEDFRLVNSITKPSQYPVPEPLFPFPEEISQVPKHCVKQARHVNAFNSWLAQLQDDRHFYYQERRAEFEKIVGHIRDRWKQAKLQWETDIAMYQELRSGYESGSPSKVASYFHMQIEAVPLLSCCEKKYETQFEGQESILLVDVKLPYVKGLTVKKTKQLKTGPKTVPASQKEAMEILNQFPFLVVMRVIWEVPKVDYQHKVKLIACNGYVVYDDPATGIVRRDVILSIVAKPEELEQIRLEKVNPEAAFRRLKGVAAARIMELVPVQPIIQFNKHDSRFIAAKEIIDRIGNENLAIMDWQDFEHLIRELFEKEFGQAGGEVRITQASRDRGVDAIAFDPDPLRGGKFVIQAKRYTNTVDVSAVRDLYGTVMNEGANRGILVTTSNYGRDAYDFAKDKPITLINGANLLHLLEKHGYQVRIDLKEAKRMINEGSMKRPDQEK